MRILRGLLIVAVAISLTTWTVGCGKPGGKRRSAGSAQGTGTKVPDKDKSSE